MKNPILFVLWLLSFFAWVPLITIKTIVWWYSVYFAHINISWFNNAFGIVTVAMTILSIFLIACKYLTKEK